MVIMESGEKRCFQRGMNVDNYEASRNVQINAPPELSISYAVERATRFPKEPDLKNRWILATGRKNWFPTKNSSICSAHFHPTDFNDTKKSRRLSQFAYPTIDVWRTSEDEESSGETSNKHSKNKAANDTSDSAPSSPESQNMDIVQPPLVNRLQKQRNRLLAALKLEKMKVKRFREQNRRKDRKIAVLHNIIFETKKKMLNKDNDIEDLKIEEVIVDNDSTSI